MKVLLTNPLAIEGEPEEIARFFAELVHQDQIRGSQMLKDILGMEDDEELDKD